MKQHALACQPIDVGGLIQLGAVGTDSLDGVIIRKDKQDVGTLGSPLDHQGHRRQEEDDQALHAGKDKHTDPSAQREVSFTKSGR